MPKPLAAFGVLLAMAATLAEARFSYDAKTGRCLDPSGNAGFNAFDADGLFHHPEVTQQHQAAFSAGDAECIDFSHFALHQWARRRGYKGYLLLRGWNFRGALLEAMDLRFCTFEETRLEGANLTKAVFGYTTVSGRIDGFSKLPVFCESRALQTSCRR